MESKPVLPPGARAVTTNYSSGSGSATLDFSIDIVLCDLAKKIAKTCINPRKKVLKKKKVMFKVSQKTICDKEKKSKDRQMAYNKLESFVPRR